jgi:hypothetical protein
MKVFFKTKVFDENLIASMNEQFYRVFDHLIFVKSNDAMNCNRANTSTTCIFTYQEKGWSHCLPVKLDFHRQHMVTKRVMIALEVSFIIGYNRWSQFLCISCLCLIIQVSKAPLGWICPRTGTLETTS